MTANSFTSVSLDPRSCWSASSPTRASTRPSPHVGTLDRQRARRAPARPCLAGSPRAGGRWSASSTAPPRTASAVTGALLLDDALVDPGLPHRRRPPRRATTTSWSGRCSALRRSQPGGGAAAVLRQPLPHAGRASRQRDRRSDTRRAVTPVFARRRSSPLPWAHPRRPRRRVRRAHRRARARSRGHDADCIDRITRRRDDALHAARRRPPPDSAVPRQPRGLHDRRRSPRAPSRRSTSASSPPPATGCRAARRCSASTSAARPSSRRSPRSTPRSATRADGDLVVVVDGTDAHRSSRPTPAWPSTPTPPCRATPGASGTRSRCSRQLTGGPTIDPVVTVDQARRSTATVARIAADVDDARRRADHHHPRGKPRLADGRSGRQRPRPRGRPPRAIRDVLPRLDRPGHAARSSTPSPTVSADTAAAERSPVAKTAIEAPVTVEVDGLTATITRATIGKALSFAPSGRQARADARRRRPARGHRRQHRLDRDARVATPAGRSSTSKPVVVPSKVGRGVNAELLATDVAGVLAETDAARRAPSPRRSARSSRRSRPRRPRRSASSSSCRRSPSTSRTPPTASRTSARRRATSTAPCCMPGDTFSLNDTIKERTPANGYTKGFVVGPGGVFAEDLGGGVSTSATTMWTAAFYAGLERVHTQAHSIWISRYRAGPRGHGRVGLLRHAVPQRHPRTPSSSPDHDAQHLDHGARCGARRSTTRSRPSPARARASCARTRRSTTTPSTCHAQSAARPASRSTSTACSIKDGEVVKREPISTRLPPLARRRLRHRPGQEPEPSPLAVGHAGRRRPAGSASPSSKPSPKPTTTP